MPKKKNTPTTPRRKRNPKPPKAARVEAVYTPDDRPRAICPTCFSLPSVSGRIYNESLSERKSRFGMSSTTKKVGRTRYTAAVMSYPCSNPDCFTEISVYTSYGETAPWKEAEKLRGKEAARFRAGDHDRKGVWSTSLASGEAVPVQQQDQVPAEPTPVAAGRAEDPPEPRKVRGRGSRKITTDPAPTFGEQLVEAVKEAVAVVKGEVKPARTTRFKDGKPEYEVHFEGPWMYIVHPVFAPAYPSGWTLDKTGRLKVRRGTAREGQVREFFKQRGVELP